MILARRSRRSVACRIGYLTLRTPKLPCLDVVYGGLLCDDDAAVRSQMIQSIHDLIRDGKADHVMVNQLPDDHPLSRELRQPSHGCVVLQPRPSGPHHRFALAPGQFSETLARFSRKHRYNLRRADRLIVDHFAGDVTLSRVQVSGMVDLFHQEAARISAIGYQGGIGAGLSDSAATRHLLHAAASAGLLRCYALRAQGEMIAYQAGFVVDDIYHLLATGFLPRYAAFSPGQVLLIRVLEDLCAAGIRTIDYGFGDAAYKRTYGNDSRTEATLHLYARRPCALVGWVIDRAAASMVARSANLIASRRIGRPIKTFWRDRLARAA